MAFDDHTKIPVCYCPVCNHELNTVGPTRHEQEDPTPNPGDPSICIECQTILTFRPDLTMRKMEDWEFNKLPPIHKAFVKHEQQRLRQAQWHYGGGIRRN